MHEYDRKCIWYNISITVTNTPTNIIEKIYTHSMQGFSKYIKQKTYYNHTWKTVQFITAIYVLELKILYQQFHITYKLSTDLIFSS